MLLLCGITAIAAQSYQEVYADAVWQELTGFSSLQQARWGIRAGQNDFHAFICNEWYDTRDTDLPFLYETRGTTVGVGYRYWLPGNEVFALVSVGEGVLDAHKGEDDIRAGFVGYAQRNDGARTADTYGELLWVERADDTFLNVRMRPGRVLHQDESGRLWAYGIGQLWASASGDNGTENRIEAGLGVGYIYRGFVTANLELRGGYSYQGTISEPTFWNPTVILAGSF